MGRKRRSAVKFCSTKDPKIAELLAREAGLASKVQLVRTEPEHDGVGIVLVKEEDVSPLQKNSHNVVVTKTAGDAVKQETPRVTFKDDVEPQNEESDSRIIDSILGIELDNATKIAVEKRYKAIKKKLIEHVMEVTNKTLRSHDESKDSMQRRMYKSVRRAIYDGFKHILSELEEFGINHEKDALRTKEFESSLSLMEDTLKSCIQRCGYSNDIVEVSSNLNNIVERDLNDLASQFNRLVAHIPTVTDDSFESVSRSVEIRAKMLNNRRRLNHRLSHMSTNIQSQTPSIRRNRRRVEEQTPRSMINQFLGR
ncbi:hypothetical protein PCE1_001327 [Barthelona sp. PCE]